MDFREHIRTRILKPTDRILEFGPLTRPTVSKTTHPKVFFADVRSTEDIKGLYTSNDYLESTGISVDLESIVEIDYVVKGSYKESFKGVERFDVVILSHVIEHMPDIVNFFSDVLSVLKKDGKLIIIYPDARYCFDHFRNGSSFVDAYDVYTHNDRSSSRVFDFMNNVVHENDPAFFWNGADQSKILPRNDFKKTLIAYEKAKSGELPDDTHFWPFSDFQFVKFLYDMDRADLLEFEINDFYETQYNTQEFMIVLSLKNGKKLNYHKYQKILSSISPTGRMNSEIKEKQELAQRLYDMERVASELHDLKLELEGVYNSRRWRTATRIADLKHSVLKYKHEKI